ncbi:hypothetical protein N9484_07990 [Polaribacter sp.]|nr:hypothetical protein [Polaribacter sp.]MDB4182657.1 hypothetical protein [Polaribacter sp.]
MINKEISEKIIAINNEDYILRKQLIDSGGGEGYHPEMEKLHLKNSATLDEIINKIGYPTIPKVGKEASAAAWLVIQHSIGLPNFMKKCLRLIQNEVDSTSVPPQHLAFLIDRINVFEGKPQLYGTQFDWDKNGQMSPQYFESTTKVNNRRKELGLSTIEDQTTLMRLQVAKEQQKAPKDFEERKKSIYAWKKKVGWLN